MKKLDKQTHSDLHVPLIANFAGFKKLAGKSLQEEFLALLPSATALEQNNWHLIQLKENSGLFEAFFIFVELHRDKSK